MQQQNQSGNGAQVDAFHEEFLYQILNLADPELILHLAKAPRMAVFVKTSFLP